MGLNNTYIITIEEENESKALVDFLGIVDGKIS
jgi:hypothetical protein